MTEPTQHGANAGVSEHRMPSKAEQEALIDAIAPRLPFEVIYIYVSVPLIGAAATGYRGTYRRTEPNPGSTYADVGNYAVVFDMPDGSDGAVHVPDWLKRVGHWPWCFIGVPVLAVVLTLALAWRATFGKGSYRIRRPYLRLMWRLLPDEMTRRLFEEEDKKRAIEERTRLFIESVAAANREERAKREADIEAEVERRVALRLEGVGA